MTAVAGSTKPPDLESWHLAGTYFEACNCEAICGCRRVGDAAGGTSDDGVCDFALSWHVEQGRAGGTSLDGLDVVLAGRYYDDAERACGRDLERWEVALYVDERATSEQATALESIFLGRVAGAVAFTTVIDTVHAVRRAAITLEHEPRRKRIEVEDRVRVIGRAPVDSSERITCGIPGHDRPGEEWIADVLAVEEAGLRWEVTGKCGFATTFSYGSAQG